MKLTIDRKKQLLEMCKAMFSECDLVAWSKEAPDTILLRTRKEEQKIDGTFMIGLYVSKHIHWFELCLTELPKRIFEQHIICYGRATLAHHQAVMVSEEIDPKTKEPIHPIDYLYTAFKSGNKPYPLK
jgi:hypothetical protein